MERKVQNIIEEANAQRHHHSSEQENLTKRLKELEVGIRYTFLSLNVMTAHMKRIIIPDTALFLSLRVSLSPSIHHPSATVSKNRLKQQCISELVRNEKTAEGAAEKHRALAQDLSVKASSLEEEVSTVPCMALPLSLFYSLNHLPGQLDD